MYVCGTGFDRDFNGFGVKGLPGFTSSNVFYVFVVGFQRLF